MGSFCELFSGSDHFFDLGASCVGSNFVGFVIDQKFQAIAILSKRRQRDILLLATN